MQGQATVNVIVSLEQLIGKYWEEEKSSHGLHWSREAYDKVPRDLIWWVLFNMSVPRGYTDIIRDVQGRVMSVRTTRGEIAEFPMIIGLHQGFSLKPLSLYIDYDELTTHIQEEEP